MGLFDDELKPLNQAKETPGQINERLLKASNNPFLSLIAKSPFAATAANVDNPVTSPFQGIGTSLAQPIAAAAALPEWLGASAAKLYAAYDPSLPTEQARQGQIDFLNQQPNQTYQSVMDKLVGKQTQPALGGGQDVLRTAATLGVGAGAFAGDATEGFLTKLNPALFGQKALGTLKPEEEAYLRAVPNSPFGQAFSIPTTDKPGVAEKATLDVFGKMTELGEKYVGKPVAELSGDEKLGQFATTMALVAAPHGVTRVGGRVIGKVGDRLSKGKTEAEVLKASPGEEMVSTVPADEAPVDPSLVLADQKALLQETLASTKGAQAKRQLSNKIKDLDRQIAELDPTSQEAILKQTETLRTATAPPEKPIYSPEQVAAERATLTEGFRERLRVEAAQYASSPEPQTLGAAPEKVNYWEALKGELPKETPIESPIERTSELQQLHDEYVAKEAGFGSHAEYLQELSNQERLSGGGAHGSIKLQPITSETMTLKQLSEPDMKLPRMKGVSYEVNIDPSGTRSLAAVNFDPSVISAEQVAGFKEKFGQKAQATEAGQAEGSAAVDSRFGGNEVKLRDTLAEHEEALFDAKDSVKERILAENPEWANPENAPRLMEAVNNDPAVVEHSSQAQAARMALDEHLGVKPGSPESEVAALLAKQPVVPEGRGLAPILGDIKTLALDPLFGERGAVGEVKLSPKAEAAYERLKADAEKLGRSIEDHLKALDMPDEVIRNLTGKAPSMGGRKVDEEFIKNIDPDNVNAEKGVIHTTKAGEKVWIAAPKVSVQELNGAFNTRDMKRGVSSMLKTPVYGFEYLGGVWQDLFHNYNKANTAKIRNIKAMEDYLGEFKKDLTHKQDQLVYQIAVARRGGGIERLTKSGVEIPKEVPKRLMDKAVELESHYKGLFDRLNEMRVNNGMKPVEGVKNYITFFGDSTLASEAAGFDVWGSPDMFEMVNKAINDTSFRFAKKATRGNIDPDMTATQALRIYNRTAEHHINIQPVVSKAKALLGGWSIDPQTGAKIVGGGWRVEQTAPGAAAFLNNWVKTISRGRRAPAFDFISQDMARKMGEYQSNLSGSMVAGNVNTVATQFSSLATVPAMVGATGVVKGLGIMNPRNMKIAESLSKVLDARSLDAEIKGLSARMDAEGPVKGGLRYAKDKLMIPASLLDHGMSYYTWWAGFKEAQGKGMSLEKAARRADEVVLKTQGSGDIGHIAPIQTTTEGAFVTMLSTYKIAFGNFVWHEMLKNPDRPTFAKLKTAIITGATMTALNEVYKAMGMATPGPDPVRAYNDARDKGFDPFLSGAEAAKHFIGETVAGSQERGISLPATSVVNSLIMASGGPEALPGEALNAAGVVAGAMGVPGITAIKRAIKGEDLTSKLVTPYK